MKIFFLVFVISCLIWSCRKDGVDFKDPYQQNIQRTLRDTLSSHDYENLDFAHAVRTCVDSVQLYFVRVPFKGKSIGSDFVLLRTDQEGRLKEGRIVHLEGDIQTGATMSM
jgi:hypothetical protein